VAHPLSLDTSTSTSPSPEGTAPHASHLAQPAPGAGLQRKNQSRGRAPQRYLVCVNTGHEKSHSFAKPVVFLDFQTHLQVAKFFLFLCFATAAALTTPALCTALLGSHNVSVFTLLGERRSFLKRIYQIRISCVHPTAAGGQQNRGAAHVPWAFRAAVPLTSRKNARSSSSRWGTPQNRYERNIKEEKNKQTKKKPLPSDLRLF